MAGTATIERQGDPGPGDRSSTTVRLTQVPMSLAALRRTVADGEAVTVTIRHPLGWTGGRLGDLADGAGFALEILTDGPPETVVRLHRRYSLADTVGPGMDLLICGLNPSPYSAESGVGFGRPGNRFWPAAMAAGLVTRDRDPSHALSAHGLGLTDLVKRPTRTAAELTVEEYRDGLSRVERLVAWLEPGVVCFVGLAGWRAAVDRTATAGPQPERLGGRPVYLMPSTSGLNAHAQLPDLEAHLRAAAVTVA